MMCRWQSQAPGGATNSGAVRSGWGGWHIGGADVPVASLINLELLAARFRQRRNGHNHDKVGANGKDRNCMTQSHGLAEISYERGKQSADGATDVIGEPLARPAYAAGEKLGEKSSNRTERARGK